MKLTSLTSAFLLATATLIALPSATNAADLKDVPRVEGTLQATPPPPGADILFDGTEKSLEAWEPSPGGKIMWPVKDGAIVVTKNDIRTKKAYGDVKMHIEWRVPLSHKSTDGQKAGNSGVIFMIDEIKVNGKTQYTGWYEVQVLESYANKGTYADGMAGAIYQQHVPTANPSLPKGEWQSYDITFHAPRWDAEGKLLSKPRFTVVFNGVEVQKDREINNNTRGRPSGNKVNLPRHPERLPITLQWHKDPVEFRNIWVIDLEKDAAK